VDSYNPLDKRNLGQSVAEALLQSELDSLPSPGARDGFLGAGVYAIYYFGLATPYPPYRRLAERNRDTAQLVPIYVGKAIPRGARTAGVGIDAPVGTVLFSRMQEHAESIDDAVNLELSDFKCRFLLVDDIWIPLGESLLIQQFKPIWNVLVGGFGNHDPGDGQRGQRRSAWDTIHPGRNWAKRLNQPHQITAEALNQRIEEFLAGEPVPTLSVREAMESEED
jgi:hypothetical protein